MKIIHAVESNLHHHTDFKDGYKELDNFRGTICQPLIRLFVFNHLVGADLSFRKNICSFTTRQNRCQEKQLFIVVTRLSLKGQS